MEFVQIAEQRRERLRVKMFEQGLDALLVYHDANRYYLSGFELHDPQRNESSGCLLIMANGQDWLCTDSRYLEAAKELWDEDRIYIYRDGGTPAKIAKLIDTHIPKGGKVGYESQALFVSFFEEFSAYITNGVLVCADGFVEKLRVIKDTSEIRLLKQSCALNHKLFSWLPSILLPGVSETTISWEIEKFFKEHGAQELSFSSIVAYGAKAALPHAVPAFDTCLSDNQLVLVDVGVRINDYCSDQTRTFWVGEKPSKHFIETLSLVQEAQQKAIAAIHPGIKAKDVYKVVYNFFEKYGVEKAFTHSLGHGVGLEVHEAPTIGFNSETLLEPGMIITIEPGLYYVGWGGVRWEYMILVTNEGADVL